MRKVGKVTLRVIAPRLGRVVLTLTGGGAFWSVVVEEGPQPAKTASPIRPHRCAPACRRPALAIRARLVFMRSGFRFESCCFTPLRTRDYPGGRIKRRRKAMSAD